MYLRAFLISVVLPGAGQILTGRAGRGAVLCLAFAAALFALLFRLVMLGAAAADPLLGALGGATAVPWAAAQADVLLQWRRARRRARYAPERDRHFAAGVRCYLRGDMTGAAESFRAAVRLDSGDADAWWHLAEVLHAQGRPEEARKARARCAAADTGGKWSELEELTA